MIKHLLDVDKEIEVFCNKKWEKIAKNRNHSIRKVFFCVDRPDLNVHKQVPSVVELSRRIVVIIQTKL